MEKNRCFIFFESQAHCGLQAAAVAIADRGLSVQKVADELVVCFPGQPIFRVRFATGETVRKLAIKLFSRSKFISRIASCDARFEVLIEDLNAALDEINSLIDIQYALQKLTKGFTYCSWNEQLMSPE